MVEDPQPSAEEAPVSGISRRRLLTTGAATTLVGAGLGAGGVALLGSPVHGPTLWTQPNQSGAQPVGGLHLQFGKDASTDVVVSWHTTDAVNNPRVMMGTPLPLFDRYQVDLVVCGHEHHYERSHPVRGTLDSETRMPIPVETHDGIIDTSKGTVHIVIGGGGTSTPSNTLFFPEPRRRVLTGVGPLDSAIGRKAPIYVTEDAPWSAFRDHENPYGFVAFDVEPGSPGGNTSIKATHYAVSGPYGAIKVVEQFTLTRPRRG